MYQKIEGGEIVDVQGIKCNLPPIGYVFNGVAKKLEYIGVYRNSDNDVDCFFERTQQPSWYKDVIKKWDNYDKIKKEDDEEFYDERLEKFKQQEWHRRLWGYWFQNGDKAVYLTGFHYYYLNYWNIDIGLPKFRRPDLEKAYFIEYCIQDPICLGICEVTKRRFGKSFFAGAFITEYTSRTKMVQGGIQSKTGEDAKKFFAKTVVNPFRRLPKFFRPVYDTSLGANPKSELRFQKPNVRGKNSNQNLTDDELGSIIDYGSAETVAYDGQKLQRYVADEVGKTTGVNVYDRHEVIRYCLLDDEANVIGKALYTTTVEKLDSDKDGVQDAFKLLWDESDQNNRQENGRTGSGLYRFFMSAKKTRNFDLYGNPDEEKTLKAILADRESVKNNQRSLSARTRKEPLTIEEAFSTDAENCVFNSANIELRELQMKEKPVVKRNIVYYRDLLTQKVKIREAKTSELDFCWHITQVLDEEQSNKFSTLDKLRKPVSTKIYAISIDSYSSSQGGRKYGSKASAWLGIKYNILDPENTGKAIGHLYGRPQVKEELHEQVMLCAEYHSCKVWYEHAGGDDYYSYFRERGKVGYLGRYPLSTIEPTKRGTADRWFGFPVTPFSLTKQLDSGISYFENYCQKIDYLELLKTAKTFDPYKRTEFDAVVAFLMLVVILFEPDTDNKQQQPLVRVYK